MHGPSLPDDSAGRVFFYGRTSGWKSPLYGEIYRTYWEYTGAYRAIDGVCDAGPFRPIGVIMPISLSIPMQYIRTVTRNILSFLFVFLFLFLFCIPVYTEMTCIFVADKDAETA